MSGQRPSEHGAAGITAGGLPASIRRNPTPPGVDRLAHRLPELEAERERAGASPRARLAAEGGEAARLRVLGVPFTDLLFEEAVERIREMLTTPNAKQVVLANAHTLNLACADPAYRKSLRDAALVLRDGVGVELASLLLGRRLRSNFVGTDFVPRCLRTLGAARPTVFLFGARPGVAEQAGRVLEAACPGVRVVDALNGYDAAPTVLARVRAARPDIVLVALGNPAQEQWIAAHRHELDCRVAIGVGALFDYLSGGVRRAPRWVRTLRSEWIFRLLTEPRRLTERYLVGNPVFLWRVVRSLLAGGRGAAASGARLP
jgi:exopolysaccharide biosynthesis WecB/TagA/CpsF family protein